MGHGVRAVVFDFDGLLMDTESTNFASWEGEWARWGLTLDRETFFAGHGGDITEHRYDLLASAVGRSFDREVSRARRTMHRDELNAALPLSAGIDSWLTEAVDLGLATAVASSSDTSWVHSHLQHVEAHERFDLVVGGEAVSAPKPSPEVYRLAIERLGVGAAEAVAVEDSAHGIDAAHAAGLTCIAIPNPYVDPARVSHAELVLTSAADCPLEQAIRLSTSRGIGGGPAAERTPT